MPQIQVMASGTAEVTAKQPVDASAYDAVILSANNLAGAETVSVFQNSGGTWIAVTEGGSPVTLTASAPSVALEGGPLYAVTKSATVGSCGVFADLKGCS
jgi:hypothetical protein